MSKLDTRVAAQSWCVIVSAVVEIQWVPVMLSGETHDLYLEKNTTGERRERGLFLSFNKMLFDCFNVMDNNLKFSQLNKCVQLSFLQELVVALF